ncbi:FkbM family methyltransferase [Streptomyces bobili]|uniref:FkbM family methyltransferase n=1 Tax=Streptomyces bobili TaxID=67280 RepID=UPI002253CC4C|nr:FkbM family methyltransferase [Streptomyces bobili]MCX5521430.1 FkbM family methyltransferase [Streptomyces bobili]
MTPPKLTEVAEGFSVHAVSALDARFLYREMFEGGTYAGISLPDEPFVIDVGANIGLFTLFVKRRRPKAHIVAFEPLPELVAALHANVAEFGLHDVSVHERALGSEEADGVSFRYYPLLPSSSTLYPQDQGQLRELLARSFPPRVVERMFQGREITVTVDRLSRHIGTDRPVDLLKIDAVGSELEILRGVDADLRPLLRNVVIDVQDVHGRVDELCLYLREMGLEPSVLKPPMADGEDTLNHLIHAVRP